MSSRILGFLAASSLLGALAAPACGGNSSDSNSSAAGNAGRAGSANGGSSGKGTLPAAGTAGTATPPVPVECGTASCSGVLIPVVNFAIPGCCADEATSHCGLDSSVLAASGFDFGEACQPLAQPGTPDSTCPVSPKTPIPGTSFQIQFPGCCRPNHSCGYDMDSAGGLVPIGLGCVDSTPFLDGGSPPSCGETGAAGAAGAAGANGEGGGAGAGEDGSGLAGAGGESSSAGAGG